jgi:hypothetical protein
MDKTKHREGKIVRMARGRVHEIALLVGATTSMWASLGGSAAAAPTIAAMPSDSGLGLGGAYLFGSLAGLALFGVRLALDVRKRHLAEHGT